MNQKDWMQGIVDLTDKPRREGRVLAFNRKSYGIGLRGEVSASAVIKLLSVMWARRTEEEGDDPGVEVDTVNLHPNGQPRHLWVIGMARQWLLAAGGGIGAGGEPGDDDVGDVRGGSSND